MEIYDSHFTPSAAKKLKAAIEEANGNEVFARGIMSDDGLICDIEVICVENGSTDASPASRASSAPAASAA